MGKDSKIHVIEMDGMWYAKYSGEKRDEIKRLFHTDTIPTPFSTSMNRAEVVKRIQAKNHEYVVD